jgi:hypothetical protein
MTWSKLDDTLTVADEPLSAFLGYGLTRNTNAYPTDLRRLTTFVYPTTAEGDAKVKWAAYERPRGTFVTVDVGIDATNFIVDVFYKTTNSALGGQIYVRHADSGAQVQVAAAGRAVFGSLQVPFTVARPLTGLQGFYIGWISDVSEEAVGGVKLNGAVANQVFCEPATGTLYPFTLATGYYEMYHLLRIATGSETPLAADAALLDYQVCGFRHNTNPARPPHGVLLVWPEIETSPAILTTATTNNPQYNSDIYELGRIELYSIAVEVLDTLDSTVLPPYAYQQPTPINELNNTINSTMVQLQPNAATNINSGGFLGCVLPAGEELTFAFFIQTNRSVQQLLTSFQCLTFKASQSSSVDITFDVRDYAGNTVGNVLEKLNYSVPRLAAQTRRVQSDDTMIAMNGVLAGDEKWGMRDAMGYLDGRKGVPVNFTWGPNVETEIAWGQNGTTDAVYYGVITATSDLYIYGFNCRVF